MVGGGGGRTDAAPRDRAPRPSPPTALSTTLSSEPFTNRAGVAPCPFPSTSRTPKQVCHLSGAQRGGRIGGSRVFSRSASPVDAPHGRMIDQTRRDFVRTLLGTFAGSYAGPLVAPSRAFPRTPALERRPSRSSVSQTPSTSALPDRDRTTCRKSARQDGIRADTIDPLATAARAASNSTRRACCVRGALGPRFRSRHSRPWLTDVASAVAPLSLDAKSLVRRADCVAQGFESRE
jgi:hypothetical protein